MRISEFLLRHEAVNAATSTPPLMWLPPPSVVPPAATAVAAARPVATPLATAMQKLRTPVIDVSGGSNSSSLHQKSLHCTLARHDSFVQWCLAGQVIGIDVCPRTDEILTSNTR